MMVLGVEIKKPSFWEATLSVAIGVGLWCALMFSPLASSDAREAGSVLAVAVFGSLTSAMGIHVGKGWRHLALNVAGSIAVLVIYHAIASLF